MSIIPLGAAARHTGLRLVINRDESDGRAAALPPRWHEVGRSEPSDRELTGRSRIEPAPARRGTRAVWPVDPVGGGSWVAGNERGVVFAILNRNLEPRPELPAGLASRGTIIPAIAHVDGVQEGMDLVRAMDVERFAPFRLVVSAAEGGTAHAAVCTWDRRHLAVEASSVPLCLASSGLGDSLVQVRLPLFNEVVLPDATAAAQDSFHGHAWPQQRERSVMMWRAGYRTVSVTSVEVLDGRVEMGYREVPRPDGRPA